MKIRYGQYDELFSNERYENHWIKMYFNFDRIFFLNIYLKKKYRVVKIDIWILQNSIKFQVHVCIILNNIIMEIFFNKIDQILVNFNTKYLRN